ncbi:MAG: NTP transferase domain-containing protein [Methanomicrobiales archaeon]|nr:NTP transferase domain-containing protein [Methanomicrobiales archaeon]MDD1669048.1 NTP transferase domain-containing protein [Methanomicrobiales archaeon]
MQAVILAAGEGTRLRPLTHSKPKAMIPVANRPVIAHVIDALLANGIRDIVVVVGYRREYVQRYLNDLDVPVTVVVQEKQLGTAHALRCAAPEIQGDFLVLPGDNYIDAASIAKIKGECPAMLVKEHPSPSNFGVVAIRDGLVSGIVEKPEEAPTQTVSTGIIAFPRESLGSLSQMEIPDAIMALIRKGMRMKAIMAEDWQDAIYPWDLLKMNQSLLRHITAGKAGRMAGNIAFSGIVRVGKGTEIGPNTTITGPVVIGEDCEIGPGTCILPGTSIGSRVRIEPFTVLGSSLIMDDTSIGSHSRILNAVIGEGCRIGDHTSTAEYPSLFSIEGKIQKAGFGAVLGDRVSTAPFTVLRTCIVGNGVEIREGRTISQILPDNTLVM